MKSNIIAIFFLCGYFATAQNLELGGYIGANHSNWTSGPGFSSKRITGFNLGVSSEYSFAKKWATNTRLEFSQVGGKNFNEFRRVNFSNDNHVIKANYLGLKIDLRKYLGKLKPSWFCQLGMGTNYALSAKEFGVSITNDLKSRLDFQTQIGFGKKINIGSSINLELLVEYLRGWNKIIKINTQSGMNQSYSLKVAVRKSI